MKTDFYSKHKTNISILIIMLIMLAGPVLSQESDTTIDSSRRSNLENVGSLFLLSSPAGAEIFIDETKELIKTPAVITDIVAGRHNIVLLKDSLIGEEVVNILRGQRSRVDIILDLDEVQLIINSNVESSRVYVDDKDCGLAPLSIEKLKTGSHKIEVSASGYKNYRETICLRANEDKILDIELYKGAKINITSNQPGTEIYINGIFTGKTPLEIKDLDKGNYKIKAIKKGFRYWETEIQLNGGETQLLQAFLHPVFQNEK